jgi:hypothetical protein
VIKSLKDFDKPLLAQPIMWKTTVNPNKIVGNQIKICNTNDGIIKITLQDK